MADLAALTAAIEAGNRVAATELTQAAVDAGTDPRDVLGAMTAAMDVIGRKFQDGEIFVPEMLIAARAMKEATAILEPVLVGGGRGPRVPGRRGHGRGRPPRHRQEPRGDDVEGRQHRGHRPRHERHAGALRRGGARARRPHHRRVGALLTTTMLNMRGVVEAVHAAGLGAKVVVGGAPVTPEFAAQIGADGYAPDAGSAVDLARGLLAR